MRFVRPVAAPRMIPTEVSAVEGHEDTIAFRLIVVGPHPMKTAVHRDVPRISKTARDDFKIMSPVITSQHTSIQPPVVRWLVIGTTIVILRRSNGLRKIRDAIRRGKAP